MLPSRPRRLSAPAALGLAAALLAAAARHAPAAPTNAAPPFTYVRATAHHVPPETTSEESGYFSLCEGLDGRIYVGTAKYGVNSFLVEYDPATSNQRVVLDTHKVCGLTATGYAAQAKLHTRNFVGPSGRVYVGSKQGYRRGGDTSAYPGGYVMTYDPRTGLAQNLGMPFPGQGIIDVVADEPRALLYAVTCEDQHWMLGRAHTNTWRELGPMLTPYATTLVDSRGRANVLTKDFQLAQYDPADGQVTVRPILVGTQAWTRADNLSIPCWNLAADGRTAWLILLNDPTLLSIDLLAAGPAAPAVRHGRMIEGQHPDSRGALTIGPDGRIYALVRIDNDTGFGSGYLHHLVRYDPPARRHEDLGVLTVSNPGFFDFAGATTHKHGYHTLPDGTLTPLHHHMAMIAARDGTLYATVLYPFTLLRIDAFRLPPGPDAQSPAARYLDAVLALCDRAEADLPRFTAAAADLARRHLAGGAIGAWWGNQCLGPEIYGRAGGIVHIGFDRVWSKDRTDAQKTNDFALIGFDRAPSPADMQALESTRARGAWIVGFGSRANPALSHVVGACHAWFDTGTGPDDRVLTLAGGERAGHLDHVANALHAWALTAELVAALTREGRMPTLWKSYSYPDGKEWGARYLGKKAFHDEFTVPPQPAGALGRAYIDRIRTHVLRLKAKELAGLRRAGELIAAEKAAGRRTVTAWAGHMPEAYVGRREDADWSQPIQLHLFLEGQRDDFRRNAADGALVLRLGYHGMDPEGPPLFREKKARVINLCGEHPDPAWQPPADDQLNLDLGWAFGDACVPIEGYPFPVFPPSGILQAVAYEAIDAEVRQRLEGAAK